MLKLLLATTFAATTSSAYAATCADSDEIVKRLKERFGEELILQSEAVNDRYFQVWKNDETGTWSMFITTPDGLHCLVGTGKDEVKGLS